MSSKSTSRRSAREGTDQAVATTAPAEAAPSDDTTPTAVEAPSDVAEPVTTSESAPEVRRCCDERKTVFVTDGIAAEPIGYCRQHLPANISRDMLQRYQATR